MGQKIVPADLPVELAPCRLTNIRPTLAPQSWCRRRNWRCKWSGRRRHKTYSQRFAETSGALRSVLEQLAQLLAVLTCHDGIGISSGEMPPPPSAHALSEDHKNAVAIRSSSTPVFWLLTVKRGIGASAPVPRYSRTLLRGRMTAMTEEHPHLPFQSKMHNFTLGRLISD